MDARIARLRSGPGARPALGPAPLEAGRPLPALRDRCGRVGLVGRDPRHLPGEDPVRSRGRARPAATAAGLGAGRGAPAEKPGLGRGPARPLPPTPRGREPARAAGPGVEPRETLSPLEDDFLEFCERYGYERPQTNVSLELAGSRPKVDCVWPSLGIALELDGFGAHSSRQAFREDRARDRRARGRGWEPIRATWEDVHLTPAELDRELRPIFDRARRRAEQQR